VRAWLALFDACHRPAVDTWSGRVTLDRIALPVAGGIGEQPARDLAAFAVIETTTLAVWREQAARHARAERRGEDGRWRNKRSPSGSARRT
jgi:hypothetical protein